MVKIAIAEYEQVFAEAVLHTFANEKDISIVKTTNSGKELLAYITYNEVDLVFLDYRMPDLNGLEGITLIKKAYPTIKVLVLSFRISEQNINQAMEAGADGYLSKSITKREILDAIAQLANGKTYFSERVHQMFLNSKIVKQDNTLFKLTPREKEVLVMVCDGQTSTQIAEELCISPTTVITHRKNLIKKFETKNSTQLVKVAVLHGYITE